MTWARFDDGYDDHPKVMAAIHANALAAALHPQAITASARRDSDGLVDPFWLLAKVPSAAKRKAALAVLVELRLFDLLPAGETRTLTDTKGWEVTIGPFSEDRHLVHDYLNYNDSSACIADKRRREAERKARGRTTQAGRNPGVVRADNERTPAGIQADTDGPDPTRPLTPPLPPASGGSTSDTLRLVDEPAPTRPASSRQRDVAQFNTAMAAWVAEHFPAAIDARGVGSLAAEAEGRAGTPVTAAELEDFARRRGPAWTDLLGLTETDDAPSTTGERAA